MGYFTNILGPLNKFIIKEYIVSNVKSCRLITEEWRNRNFRDPKNPDDDPGVENFQCTVKERYDCKMQNSCYELIRMSLKQ